VYSMRMARVNITIPDELYRQAKAAGVNVSQLAQHALISELSRADKLRALDEYIAELEAELGPPSAEALAAAEAWADKIFGPETSQGSS
jgi:post-segregation antitoxin (ccd killing protein)